jgi:hypothetical protein
VNLSHDVRAVHHQCILISASTELSLRSGPLAAAIRWSRQNVYIVAYIMYRHNSEAGPSETGVEWEAPGVQRPGENRGPRDARNYSRVGWPILTDTAEGTAGGTTKWWRGT